MSFLFLCLLSTLLSIAISYAPSKAAPGWMDIEWDFNKKEIDLKITGSIPSWLNGSLYRNGPAIWRFGDDAQNPHWFEGLGLLEAFHFNNNSNGKTSVSFYCSFINSTEYNRFDPNINYTSNITSFNSQVTIRRIGNTLLANGGNPLSNSFDPITTQTIQHPFIYNDNYMNNPFYNEASPSHSQASPNGEIFHMIYVFGEGPIPGYYQLYHIAPNNNTRIMAQHKVRTNPNINNPTFQHMTGLTEHYVILCEAPFDMLNGSWLDGLGVTWYVVDKYTAELIATFYSDDFMYFHWANSYEYINETTGELNIALDIAIDVNGTIYDALYLNKLVYEWQWSMDLFCTGNLSRFILPLNRSGHHIKPTVLSEFRGVEMPVIWYDKYNTKQYKYVYQVGVNKCSGNDRSEFWDTLIKTEVQFDGKGKSINWYQPNTFVTEPIFAPNPSAVDEDDGVILSLALDSATNSSYLLILDAKNMKELARVIPSVIQTIPFGFHGRFYSDL